MSRSLRLFAPRLAAILLVSAAACDRSSPDTPTGLLPRDAAQYSSASAAAVADLRFATSQAFMVRVGDSLRVSVEARDASGAVLTKTSVITSMNPDIARIERGQLIGLKPGVARVVARVESKQLTGTFAVMPATVASAPGSSDTLRFLSERNPIEMPVEAEGALPLGGVPSGAAVVWSSTDTSIVRVGTTGRVKAIAPGTASIHASAGGRVASIGVRVVPKPTSQPTAQPTGNGGGTDTTRLRFDPERTSAELVVGNTLSLVVRGVTAGTATEWSSSATSIASVSSTGVVTAIADGAATITAANAGRKVALLVHVSRGASNTGPSLSIPSKNGTIEVVAGTEWQIPVEGLTATAPQAWSSSDTSIVFVSSTGRARAQRAGNAVVTVASNGKTAYVNVKVTAPPATARVYKVTVVQPEGHTSVAIGESLSLVASAIDSTGHPLTDQSYQWAVTPAAVATFLATGSTSGATHILHGVTAGQAIVTVTVGGKSATYAVAVTTASVQSVTVAPRDTTLTIGSSATFRATVLDKTGAPVAAAHLTWRIENPTIAAIGDNGVVRALTAGETTVSASFNGVTGSARLKVIPNPADAIGPPTTMTLITGDSVSSFAAGKTLVVSAVLWDAKGHAVKPADAKIVFTVSDSMVARVASTEAFAATVYGVKPGTVTVTASWGSLKAARALVVTPAAAAPVPTRIVIDPAQLSLEVSATARPVARVLDRDGKTMTDVKVTWQIANPAVAVVHDGAVSGVAVGATILKASVGEVHAEIPVTVVAKKTP